MQTTLDLGALIHVVEASGVPEKKNALKMALTHKKYNMNLKKIAFLGLPRTLGSRWVAFTVRHIRGI